MLALFVIIAQTGCVQDMVGGRRDLDVIGNLEIAEMFDELPRLGWMWWCCHYGRLGVNRKWWRDLAPSLYTSSIIFHPPPSSIRRQDAEVGGRRGRCIHLVPSLPPCYATFLSSYHDFPVSSTRYMESILRE